MQQWANEGYWGTGLSSVTVRNLPDINGRPRLEIRTFNGEQGVVLKRESAAQLIDAIREVFKPVERRSGKDRRTTPGGSRRLLFNPYGRRAVDGTVRLAEDLSATDRRKSVGRRMRSERRRA